MPRRTPREWAEHFNRYGPMFEPLSEDDMNQLAEMLGQLHGLRVNPYKFCQCEECKALRLHCGLLVGHYSHCAVHNEPAYPKGECNCGAIQAAFALIGKHVPIAPESHSKPSPEHPDDSIFELARQEDIAALRDCAQALEKKQPTSADWSHEAEILCGVAALLEQLPEGYALGDDASVPLAVKCAELERRVRGMVSELADYGRTVTGLRKELARLRDFENGVREALNSGDGSYHP